MKLSELTAADQSEKRMHQLWKLAVSQAQTWETCHLELISELLVSVLTDYSSALKDMWTNIGDALYKDLHFQSYLLPSLTVQTGGLAESTKVRALTFIQIWKIFVCVFLLSIYNSLNLLCSSSSVNHLNMCSSPSLFSKAFKDILRSMYFAEQECTADSGP